MTIFDRKSLVLIIVSAVIAPVLSFAQLDTSQLINWKYAGVDEFFWPEHEIQTLNCDNTGKQPCDQALQSILNQKRKKPLVLFIPNGTYLFKEHITVPSNVLIRGASPTKTVLVFEVPENHHCFRANGRAIRKDFPLSNAPKLGDTVLTGIPNGSFVPGDQIALMHNDKHLVTREWGENNTGQIFIVKGQRGNRVTVDVPVRLDYEMRNQPRVQPLEMVHHIGFENFSIIRRSASSRQVSNFYFRHAHNIHLYGIMSDSCHYAHVDIRNSKNVKIEKSYFCDGHDHGEGGKAYGVIIHAGSCDVLVVDNIFQNLRHSMIIQSGGNGNVFAYNYSTDVKATRSLFGFSMGHDISGDMVVHGNYAYRNLFEGNHGHMGIIDNAHGTNGPGNTFYRNCIVGYGITVTNNRSHNQIFIENKVNGPSFFMAQNHYFYNNTFNNFDNDANRPNAQITSLGLDVFPEGIDEDLVWKMGNPLCEELALPAEKRYVSGLYVPTSGRSIMRDRE
ncbi:MAG: hypothetical protein JJU02_05375 [Cryomorphaceae bacterium]|nr:hypothetical protein [Cryomorphaceae bacterium]